MKKIEENTPLDQMGFGIAAYLRDGADSLPNDISERLKVARAQALAKRKVLKLEAASDVSNHGGALALHMGDEGHSLWNRIAYFLPLLVLIIGMMVISTLQDQWHSQELADIDTELLTDDLPPSAYTDPGFVHFLSANKRD